MSVYTKPDSKYFWYAFTFNGKRVQKSTKVTNRQEAKNIEKLAWAQHARHEVGVVEKPNWTIGELLDRLELRWKDKAKYSAQNVSLLKKTRAAFSATKLADELTKDDVEAYVRREKKTSKIATVNRAVQCLRAAYRLENAPWPKYKLESESGNVRKGFFSPEQMKNVLANLADDGLRDFIRWCYVTGQRRGEVAGLTWNMIAGDELHIPGDITKNKDPRTLPLAGELAVIIDRRKKFRLVNGSLTLPLFHRGDGTAILEFRKSWKTATTKAGCPGMIPHDMRRSVARDLLKSGVSEQVSMNCTGHKTRSMWSRYAITTTDDVRAAFAKVAKYRAG